MLRLGSRNSVQAFSQFSTFQSFTRLCSTQRPIKIAYIPRTTSTWPLRPDGPSLFRKPKLLSQHWSFTHGITDCKVPLKEQLHYFIKHQSPRQWVMTLATSIGLSVISFPVLSLSGSIFFGLFYCITEGLASQVRTLLFSPRPNIDPSYKSSPVALMIENMINYALILNAALQFKPWKSEIENSEEIIESLNGYTGLQQLFVKEPIVDRCETPRIVSNSSAKIIWDQMQLEAFHLFKARNIWIDQQPFFVRYYLRLITNKISGLDAGEAGLNLTINTNFDSFEDLYDAFVARTEKAMFDAVVSMHLATKMIFIILGFLIAALFLSPDVFLSSSQYFEDRLYAFKNNLKVVGK